ncbi:MAG TPA: hypothetical protein VNZ52_07945 [Candidatus Thermoplasmatota archaeon]|nr:hypothetical protein [Candidatus Thermoplasmatota archaeon]
MQRAPFLDRALAVLLPGRALPGFLFLLVTVLLVAGMVAAFMVEHAYFVEAQHRCSSTPFHGSCHEDLNREHAKLVATLAGIALLLSVAAGLLLSLGVAALAEADLTRRSRAQAALRTAQLESWYAEGAIGEAGYARGLERVRAEAERRTRGRGFLLLGQAGRATYLLGFPLVLLGWLYLAGYVLDVFQRAGRAFPDLSDLFLGFAATWAAAALAAETAHAWGRRLRRADRQQAEAEWQALLAEARSMRLATRR